MIAWAAKELLCDGEAGQKIFDVVCWAYRVMPKLSTTRRSLVEQCVLLMMIKRAGLMLQLDRCQRCSEKQPKEAVVLRKEGDGWECLSCCARLPEGAMSLSPRGLMLLRLMAASPGKVLRTKVTDEDVFELGKLIRKLMTINVGEYTGQAIALCVGSR